MKDEEKEMETLAEFVNDFLNNRVHIVRCKDCKWCFKTHDEGEEYLVCGVLGCDIPDDYFFCAYGEVKDDKL